MQDRNHKSSRRKYIILLSIAVVLLGGYLGIRYFLASGAVEKRLTSELQNLVSKGSRGLYHLEIGKLKVDPDNINVSLYNLKLKYDTTVYQQMVENKTAPEHLFDISLEKVVFERITPASFITDKRIILTTVQIFKGSLSADRLLHDFHRKIPAKDTTVITDTSAAALDLYALLSNDVKEIRIDTILATGLDLVYHAAGKKERKTELKNLDFLLEDLEINEFSGADSTRFLYSKSMAVRLKDFTLPFSDNQYNLSLDTMNLMISGGETFTDIRNLNLISPLGETEFTNRNKSQLERFDLRFPYVVLKNFSYQQLLSEGILQADSAGIKDAKIRIFKDRSQPADGKSKVGQYPHQLLKKADMLVRIPLLSFTNTSVEYREKSEVTLETGAVSFTRINATVSNIYNSEEDIVIHPTMVLRARALFMGAATVDATFRFFNNKTGGRFEVDGDFGAFDATIINKASVPLGLVEIKSGRVNDLSFRLRGNNYSASTSVHLVYD
ncbi:MAG TPA: hypothetical protein VIK74_03950, partial [Parasegetibacter sp.]